MKRDKVDIVFSKYIRARDNWTCVRCGTRYQPGDVGLHCSHVFSRRHKRIRWDPRNAVSHCFGCHKWYGENPVESSVWVREYLGNEVIEELLELKRKPYRMQKHEKEEIYQKLKTMLADLERRAA